MDPPGRGSKERRDVRNWDAIRARAGDILARASTPTA
jgi:hypothetical protein